MKIQKYKARIRGTDKEVIGYIAEVRKYLGEGAYSDEKVYLLSVTSFSMPGGPYGNYLVDQESIEEYDESITKHNGRTKVE